MKTISVSQVRSDIKQLTGSTRVSAITNHGRIVAVLVPVPVSNEMTAKSAIEAAKVKLDEVEL